jgi:4-hydroxy-tetrahydrodipicolinate synthase
VISVTANVAPKAVRTMLAASKQGKKADAETINDYLMPLHKRLFLESNPIPVKRALQLMGKIDTGIRSPLVKMDDVHVDALREALILGKVL